jgi:hypothetical protein
MRSTFMRRLGALLGAAVLVGACGGSGGAGFSEDFRRVFMNACTSGESETFCACYLDQLETRYTEAEITRVVISQSEELPEGFVEAGRVCLDQLNG